MPRIKQNWLPLTILLVIWAVFFSRTLFLGQVYFLDDLKIIFYPLEHVYGQFQSSWQLPQWSPLFGFGQPLLAWGQLGFFTPLHLLLRFLGLPSLVLLQVSILSYFALGLFGMFVFLRRRALRGLAAALGAIVFTFSGFSVGHLNHVNFYVATMVLPWLLIAIDAFVSKPTLRRAAIMAALAAVIPLSGQPQISLYTLLIAGLFGLILVIRSVAPRPGEADRTRRQTIIKLATLTILASLLVLSLASFAIFPLWEFLPNTERAGGLAETELFEFSYPPAHAITLIFPYFFGDHTSYWGAKNFQELSAYVGVIPLLLAGLALVHWKKNRSDRTFALLLILIGVTFSLGVYSPFYRYLVEHKILTTLSVPGRFVYFFNTGIALLASLGLNDIIRRLNRHHRLQTIIAATLVTISAATLIYYGWDYNPLEPGRAATAPSPFINALRQFSAEQGVPPRLYASETLPVTGNNQLSFKPTEVISPSFTVHQPITLRPGVSCFQFPAQVEEGKQGSIQLSLRERPDGPPLFETTLNSQDISQHTNQRLCLPDNFPTHLERLYFTAASPDYSNIKLFYQPSDAASVYFVRVSNPTPGQLAKSQKPGRLLLEPEVLSTADLDTALLLRHLHVTAGASSARWIGALSIAPYRDLIEDLFANDRDPFNGEGVHALAQNRTMVNMSGITHLTQAIPPDATSDAMIISGYQLVQEALLSNKSVRLYRNPDAFPKAFLVNNIVFEPDVSVVRYQLSQPDYQPDKLIYLYGPTPPANIRPFINEIATGSTRIIRYEPTQVDVYVSTPNDTWLTLTDSWTPQWRTYLDNKLQDSFTANSVWRATFVPAGQHTVSFRYFSPAIELAKKLTVFALLATTALIILPLRRAGEWLNLHP